jgi:hypothetical protein
MASISMSLEAGAVGMRVFDTLFRSAACVQFWSHNRSVIWQIPWMVVLVHPACVGAA